MRVVLVDDEPLALRGLAQLLARESDVEVVGVAQSGAEALRIVAAQKPDVLFLDIQMPSLTGLEVAAALGREGGPDIVFVTAFDGYAADAFAVDAVDYLLKPLDPDRLRQSLHRARRRQMERSDYGGSSSPAGRSVLQVPARHGAIDIAQDHIVWIEAAKDYGLIHTDDRSYIVRTTMTELANRLDDTIMRVHRSAFVSLARVQRIRTTGKSMIALVLEDGTAIPVGPSYVKKVRAAVQRRPQGVRIER